MTISELRQCLHQYIDGADEIKVKALYTLLIGETIMYPPEELDALHQRAENFLKGETKTYTVEDSHEMIRQKRRR